jgi:hypothetical protein
VREGKNFLDQSSKTKVEADLGDQGAYVPPEISNLVHINMYQAGRSIPPSGGTKAWLALLSHAYARLQPHQFYCAGEVICVVVITREVSKDVVRLIGDGGTRTLGSRTCVLCMLNLIIDSATITYLLRSMPTLEQRQNQPHSNRLIRNSNPQCRYYYLTRRRLFEDIR